MAVANAMPWLLGLGLVLFCIAAPAQTALRELSVTTPRPFGYVIGDRFQHRIDLALNPPYSLDYSALPKPGRVTHWLELYQPVVSQRKLDAATHYTIDLTYQIVNISSAGEDLFTPQQKLFFRDRHNSFAGLVPPWRWRMHALTDPRQPASELRPDQPPLARPLPVFGLWLAATGLGGALAGLIYLHAPRYFGRRPGPFARACRQLQRLPQQPWDDEHYRQALRCIHAAFNQTAGHTVFAEKLDVFFEQQPRFNSLRQPIERFFEHTRGLFFAGPESSVRYSGAALLALCRDCRNRERGLS